MLTRCLAAAIAIATLCVAPVDAAIAVPISAHSAEGAIAAAMAGVVRIERVGERAGYGSGFVFDSAGNIVTNAHVVGDAHDFVISFADGRRTSGHLVGRDPRIDLAVIRIEPFPGLRPLTLATTLPPVGAPVFALGSPMDFPFSASSGIVSGAGRAYDLAWPVDFLQHDAALNPGNSGGPLIDRSGRVLGLNTATPQETIFDIGIGLAIPSDLVARTVEAMIRDGRIERGALGLMVSIADDRVAAALGASGHPGLLIDAVSAGGAADRAGLQAGDILLAIDGAPLARPRDLSIRLLDSHPGQEVRLSLIRGGRPIALPATLQLDDPNGGKRGHATRIERAAAEPDLGLQFEADAQNRVHIAAIRARSAAEQSGLRPGDIVLAINGLPAGDIGSIDGRIRSLTTDVVVLRVERQGIGIRHVTLPRTGTGVALADNIAEDRSVGPV